MKNICSTCLNIVKKLAKVILILLATIALLAALYLSIDYLFKGILSYIARSVLSNFIVFASIIFLVLKFVVRPNKLIEKAQKDVVGNIEKAQQAKLDSEERLVSAQERIKNIEVEIEEIIRNSEKNAQQAGAKILDDAQKVATSAKDDIKKVIQNNQFLLKNDIMRRTSNALLEIAKSNIIKELDRNPQLHDKLIDDSIQAIVLNEQIEEV